MAADQIVGTAIKTIETLGITEIGTIETMNMATVITEKTKEETMIKSMEKPCKFLMYLYLSDVCLAECSSVLLVSSDDAVLCFLLNFLTVSRSGLLSINSILCLCALFYETLSTTLFSGRFEDGYPEDYHSYHSFARRNDHVSSFISGGADIPRLRTQVPIF